jgi:hypothetical protein
MKIGDFIYLSQWGKGRFIRIDYIGKKRGMGTVYYYDYNTGSETPFTFDGYEKKWKIKKKIEIDTDK